MVYSILRVYFLWIIGYRFKRQVWTLYMHPLSLLILLPIILMWMASLTPLLCQFTSWSNICIPSTLFRSTWCPLLFIWLATGELSRLCSGILHFNALPVSPTYVSGQSEHDMRYTAPHCSYILCQFIFRDHLQTSNCVNQLEIYSDSPLPVNPPEGFWHSLVCSMHDIYIVYVFSHTWVPAHMMLSIREMRRNGIQHHAPPDDPYSLISLLLILLYGLVWFYACKCYICLPISAHGLQE